MAKFIPDPQDVAANKIVAMVSWIGILFWLPMVSCPASPFAKHCSSQGLLLLIASIASTVIHWIPIIGFVAYALDLAILAMTVIGMLAAYNGDAYEIPVVGSIQLLK